MIMNRMKVGNWEEKVVPVRVTASHNEKTHTYLKLWYAVGSTRLRSDTSRIQI